MPKIKEIELDIREALNTKAQELYPDKTLFTVKELSEISGIPSNTIYNNKRKYPIYNVIPVNAFARMICN